jgi:hypothetical protein
MIIKDKRVSVSNKYISKEDRLFYADDVLLIATSTEQLEKAIRIVENWAGRNGMSLNKKKSGIVIFANRRAKKIPMMEKVPTNSNQKKNNNKINWMPTHKDILGVPICDKYKYLGTWLDSKLTCGPQISHIRKKAAHIYVKLYPYLMSASADARRDMWQTMVAPLFNAAYVLLEYEPSETHKTNLERVQKMTFKQFLMVSKRTNTTLVNDMIRRDLRRVAQVTVRTCKAQWEERKYYKPIKTRLPNLSRKNGLRGVPNSWSELINTMIKPCPKCKTKGTVTNRWHLLTKHGIRLPHINHIWKNDILPVSQMEEEVTIEREEYEIKIIRPVERTRIRKILKPLIQKHLDNYYRIWASLLTQSAP